MTLTTMIAELEEAERAATPGPWYVGHNELGHAQGPMSIWPDPNMVGALIAQCGAQMPWHGWYEQPSKDARLIALMRNSLPALIEAVKRQGEALEKRDALIAEMIGKAKISVSYEPNSRAWARFLEEALEARAALKEPTDV